MSYSPAPEPMVICGKDTVNVVKQQDITTLDPELSQLMKSEDSVEIQCPIPGTNHDSKDGQRKVVPSPAPTRGTQHSPCMLGYEELPPCA